jgi:hypothetical protein
MIKYCYIMNETRLNTVAELVAFINDEYKENLTHYKIQNYFQNKIQKPSELLKLIIRRRV